MSGDITIPYDVDILLQVTDWVCTYYSLALLILGCLCNPLSFVVFSRRKFRDSTISIYLRILAVSDLGAILNGLLPYFINRVSGLDPRVNDVACLVSMYVYFFALYTSSWTLVIVTTERVVSILQPHRVQIICSRYRIKLVLGVFFILVGLLSVPCPILLYSDLEIFNPVSNITEVKHCAPVYVVEHVLPLLITDTTMFAFLPCLLLIIFNIIIVDGIIRSRNRVMKSEENLVYDQSDSNTNPNKSKSMKLRAGQNRSSRAISSKMSRRSAREASLTLTLVAVNVTFIVCNFPATAWGLGPQFQGTDSADPLDYAIIDLLIILMYTNNSLNFLLYCATGSKFRVELKSIFTGVLRRSG